MNTTGIIGLLTFIIVCLVVALVLTIVFPSTVTRHYHYHTYKRSKDYGRLKELIDNGETILRVEDNKDSGFFGKLRVSTMYKRDYSSSTNKNIYIMGFLDKLDADVSDERFKAYCVLNDVEFLDMLDDE